MNVADKERLIAKISCGKILVTVGTKNGDFTQFILRSPTPDEQAHAALIYETEYQRAILMGLLPENDVICNLISIGQWSEKLESEIAGLKDDIQTIRRGLLGFLFNTTKLEYTRKTLRNAEKALIERLTNRYLLTRTSADARAVICQQRFIISKITETIDRKPHWPTTVAFEDDDDYSLASQLCEIYFQRSRISSSVIRELARSQQWRIYWDVVKHNGVLFDGPITAWSQNQKELAHWSTIYDSVYGAYERPSEDIIADDDLLDSWFIQQGEKIADKSKKVPELPLSKKKGRNEVFIMSDRDGAKKVYDMNNSHSRAKIRAKQRLLEKHGNMEEQHMPDSQREMKEQLVDMRKSHIKSINKR